MVTIHGTYAMSKLIGGETFTLERADTVREVVDQSAEKFGKPFADLLQNTAVILNGIHVSDRKGYKTKVRDGDELWFVNPAAGG